MTDIAAVVAAAANSRGIGYKGQLVRLPHSSLGVLHVWTKCCTQGLDQLTHKRAHTALETPWGHGSLQTSHNGRTVTRDD